MSPEMKRKTLELRQVCPLCGRRISPYYESTAVASAVAGDIDDEEARRLVLVAHIRHQHTRYDEIAREAEEQEMSRGTPTETALQLAKARARTLTARRIAWLIRECEKPSDQRVRLVGCFREGTLGTVARIVFEADRRSLP